MSDSTLSVWQQAKLLNKYYEKVGLAAAGKGHCPRFTEFWAGFGLLDETDPTRPPVLLNKRDITQVVAPEEGIEISLESIALRITQLVVKNSVRTELEQQKTYNAELLMKIDTLKKARANGTNEDRTWLVSGYTYIPKPSETPAGLRTSSQTHGDEQRLPPSRSEDIGTTVGHDSESVNLPLFVTKV